uniref:Uncharacterized protein n=1 Tax=Oryza meridionalis TaxID=40149 RepID=A0A0E0CJW8_9ORYZ
SPRERSGDDRRLPSSAGSGEPAPPSSKESSPPPSGNSLRLSLPDFPLSVANRGAEPLPSFALPAAQSTERQRDY